MTNALSIWSLTTRRGQVLFVVGWTITGLAIAAYRPIVAIATLTIGVAIQTLDSPISGFAIGQVGIAIASPGTVVGLAVLEVGPAILLGALLAEHDPSLHMVGIAVIFGTLLGTVVVLGLTLGDSLVVAGIFLLGAVALLGYGIHRYELVTTGLVTGKQS